MPRLRIFLSADIVGSTSLKQSTQRRSEIREIDAAREQNPKWFTIIQGFYHSAAQNLIAEWLKWKEKAKQTEQDYYGPNPRFWKTAGDEIIFTKIVTDHRQVRVIIACWLTAIEKIRDFLKKEKSNLDVKCTIWMAGFPIWNQEIAVNKSPENSDIDQGNFFISNGNLLNKYYNQESDNDLIIDYIGPSIDTGFRLSSLSTTRKMIISVDVAFIISLTDQSKPKGMRNVSIFFDGTKPLRGVIGGDPYPIFWIDTLPRSEIFQKEDALNSTAHVSIEKVKDYCYSFYEHYQDFFFAPFIGDPSKQTASDPPDWYEEHLNLLVKNFNSYITTTEEPNTQGDTISDEQRAGLISDLIEEDKNST